MSSIKERSEQAPEHNESDEDMFTVPDMEAAAQTSIDLSPTATNCRNDAAAAAAKRKRGRNPADKELRRLKRLLRNRVSAQQARERKKVYVHDLELRAQELQDRSMKLEEKISTLINENAMLRKIVMNTRRKMDDNIKPKHGSCKTES